MNFSPLKKNLRKLRRISMLPATVAVLLLVISAPISVHSGVTAVRSGPTRLARQMDGMPEVAPPGRANQRRHLFLGKKFMPSELMNLGFVQPTPEVRPEITSSADRKSAGSKEQIGVADVFWSVGRFLDKYRDFISKARSADDAEAQINPPEVVLPEHDYILPEEVDNDEEGFVTRAKSTPYHHPMPHRYNLLKFKPDDVSPYDGPPEPRNRFRFGLGKKR